MSPIRLAAVLLALSATAYAMPQAAPGEWEISAQMHMDGKTKMDMPPTKVKFCMKPQDVQDPTKQGFMHGPQRQGQAPNCKKIDSSVSGDTVKFHMRCEGANASDIQGEITYTADSYKGHTVIDTESPRGKMHMVNDFSAKRLGDCTK